MKNKKMFYNKMAKGLVSLITIILLLSSILATSIYYNNNITANVVKEVPLDSELTDISIIEVDNIKELNQLNEGWYEIRNGFVFYLDTFNSYVPLYIKVKGQQDALMAVDAEGNIEFGEVVRLLEREVADEYQEENAGNEVSGDVTGYAVSLGCISKTNIQERIKCQNDERYLNQIIEQEKLVLARIKVNTGAPWYQTEPRFELRKNKETGQLEWYEIPPAVFGLFPDTKKVTGDISAYIKDKYGQQLDSIELAAKDDRGVYGNTLTFTKENLEQFEKANGLNLITELTREGFQVGTPAPATEVEVSEGEGPSLPPRTEESIAIILEDLKSQGATSQQLAALKSDLQASEEAKIVNGYIIRSVSTDGEPTGAYIVYNDKGERIAFRMPEGDVFAEKINQEEAEKVLSSAGISISKIVAGAPPPVPSPAPSTPLEQLRQERASEIQDLERQKEASTDRNEQLNLQNRIDFLKNTAPPSEKLVKLAEAADINLQELAKRFNYVDANGNADVSQLKVQDITDELLYNRPLKTGYEYRISDETKEPDVYAKGAKEPVHDLAVPGLLGNVQPTSIQRETAPATPAVSTVASILPPSPPQEIINPVRIYYQDKENGQVYALILGPSIEQTFYYKFDTNTRTWNKLAGNSPEVEKIINPDTNDKIQTIRNLEEVQAIINKPAPAVAPAQAPPPATQEPSGGRPPAVPDEDEEDVRVASDLPEAPRRTDGSLDTDEIPVFYTQAGGPLQIKTSPIKSINVDIPYKNLFNPGIDETYTRQTDPRSGKVEYVDKQGQRRSLIDTYNDVLNRYGNRLQSVTIEDEAGKRTLSLAEFKKEFDNARAMQPLCCNIVKDTKTGSIKISQPGKAEFRPLGPNDVVFDLLGNKHNVKDLTPEQIANTKFTSAPVVYVDSSGEGIPLTEGSKYYDSNNKEYTLRYDSRGYPYAIASDGAVETWATLGKLGSTGIAGIHFSSGDTLQPKLAVAIETGGYGEDFKLKNYEINYRPNGIRVSTPYGGETVGVIIDEAFGGRTDELIEQIKNQYSFFVDGKKVAWGKESAELWNIYELDQVDANGNAKQGAKPIIMQPNTKVTFSEISPQAIPPKKAAPAPSQVAPKTKPLELPPKPEPVKTKEYNILDAAKAKIFNTDLKLAKLADNLDAIGYPKSETNKIRLNNLDAIQTAQMFMGFEGKGVDALVGDKTLVAGDGLAKKYANSQALIEVLDQDNKRVGVYNPIAGKGVIERINTLECDPETNVCKKYTAVFSGSLESLNYYAGSIPLTDQKGELLPFAAQTVNSIQNLNQLGEGLYFTEKGVVYLFDESSGTTIPTFVQVENKDQQNTYFSVNYKGDIDIRRPLPEKTTGVQPTTPTSTQVTPSLTLQQKQNTAAAVNPYIEREAKKAGREFPNEEDYKKGVAEYMRTLAAQPQASIRRFLIEEYPAYQKEPKFVEKAPPPRTGQVQYIELNDVQRQVLIESKEAEILGSSNEKGVYTVGEDVYLVDTQGNYVKLDYSPKHEAYVLPGTENVVDITYGSDAPPRSTVPTTFVAPAPQAPKSLDTSNYKFNDGTKSILLDKKTLQPCEKAGGNCVEVKPGEVLFTGADSAAKPATPPKAPIPGAPVEPGKPLPPSRTETIPVLGTDGKFYMLEVFKPAEGKQKLKYGDVDIEVPESLLKGVDLRKNFAYDAAGGIISVTAPTGENREISKIGATYVAIDKRYEEKKGLTKETKTEILEDSTTRITTIQNPNTNEQQINRKTVLPDGKTTVEIQFEKNTGEDLQKAKVSVTVDGRTSQFIGTVLSTLQEKNPSLDENRRNQLLVEAARTGADINKAGEGIVGDQNGVHLMFNKQTITHLRGKQVTGYTNLENGERATIEGNAELTGTGGNIDLKKGAIVSITDKTGKIQRIIESTSDGLEAVESIYEPDGSLTVKIGIYNPSKREVDATIPALSQTFKGVREYTGPIKELYRHLEVSKDRVYIERGFFSDSVKVAATVTRDGKTETRYLSLDELPKDCIESGLCTRDVKVSAGPFGGVFVIGKEDIVIDSSILEEGKKANANKVALTRAQARREEREGKPSPAQEASQRFFAEIDRLLSDFSGFGYYATLFLDEDKLLKWRDDVDRLFATLYLGTEYWSSSICGQYLDGEDEGIAYAETAQGFAQVGAHIEATRTEPIQTDKGQEFIYKITFNVRNGDYDKDPRAPERMHINVVLKGERTIAVFKQEQEVKRGSSFGRTGRNAIAKASPAVYTQVCLTFDNVPLRWKLDNGELCNNIVESSGGATPVSTGASSTAASGIGGAAEGELNDF